MTLSAISSSDVKQVNSWSGLTSFSVKDLIDKGSEPSSQPSKDSVERFVAYIGFHQDGLFDLPECKNTVGNVSYWSKDDSIKEVLNSPTAESTSKTKYPCEGDRNASTTTKNGTTVSFMTGKADRVGGMLYAVKLERPDGLNVVVDLKENARITEEEDGSLSIYYPGSHEKQTFDSEGNLIVGYASDAEPQGTDGDDIFISVLGGGIELGEGDDVIFNVADNAWINAGNGNNHITDLGGRGLNITCGDGDNTFEGGFRDSSITTGNGNNKVSGGLYNTHVSMGDGNHTIHGFSNQSDLTVGAGETLVEGSSIGMNITAHGEGKLRVKAEDAYFGHIETDGDLDAVIQTLYGDIKAAGNSTILINGSMNNAQIQTGDGNDNIYISSGTGNVITGGGNDSISVRWGRTPVINGRHLKMFEDLYGARESTAFNDPFFGSIAMSGFSMEIAMKNAATVSR